MASGRSPTVTYTKALIVVWKIAGEVGELFDQELGVVFGGDMGSCRMLFYCMLLRIQPFGDWDYFGLLQRNVLVSYNHVQILTINFNG